MAMPIPKSLLPQSATHKYGQPTDDGWGNKALPSSRTLSHVRFEPSTKLVVNKENQQVQLSALMFFDCRNSAPAGISFAIGDQISKTDGAAYTIVGGVDPIWDERRPHHLELELV